ncbi:winged helix-turn-helix transcriptional regulator [Novosphingobium gossypii]|uniref:winged helix-turn-helix transcriptional regulator n=1 Tax=Novosphingobium gossypii TaxID=1604774 RepID=UPI003D1DE300
MIRERAFEHWEHPADVLSLVEKRWLLRIVDALSNGPLRFSDIRRRLPGISAKMLTLRLTEMQALALIEMVVPSRPEVRAYKLTMRGQMLRRVVRSVRELEQGSLGDDHANAHYLASRLAEVPGLVVDLDDVHIDMVWYGLPAGMDPGTVVDALGSAGIKASGPYGGRLRRMTHWQIDRAAIDTAVEVIAQVLERWSEAT